MSHSRWCGSFRLFSAIFTAIIMRKAPGLWLLRLRAENGSSIVWLTVRNLQQCQAASLAVHVYKEFTVYFPNYQRSGPQMSSSFPWPNLPNVLFRVRFMAGHTNSASPTQAESLFYQNDARLHAYDGIDYRFCALLFWANNGAVNGSNQ